MDHSSSFFVYDGMYALSENRKDSQYIRRKNMKKLTEKSPVLLFGTTILAAALLLGGCSGKDGSKSVSEAADPTGSSVSSEESQASDEPIDYSKYNAYLSVADSIYEMDDMLGAYFTVVQDQPEFALSEGMDYALLEDAFSSYISQEYLMDDALTYVDKEPGLSGTGRSDHSI